MHRAGPMLLVLATLCFFALVGCNWLGQLAPEPTLPPIAPLAPFTGRPQQAPPAAPRNPPAARPQPPASVLPGSLPVTNFTAKFTGRTVEGGFDVGTQHVDYVYRIKRLDLESGRIRATGDIEYALDGQRQTVANVGARMTAQGAQCRSLQIETDPFRLEQTGVEVPAQQFLVDPTAVSGADSTQARLLCEVARVAQDNPNNPLIRALIDQLNRQLSP